MKSIWGACDEAEIGVPAEVGKFFEDCEPDEAGVEVDIDGTVCCREYREEMREGFEIDVTTLPKDVTIIRFWNSY